MKAKAESYIKKGSRWELINECENEEFVYERLSKALMNKYLLKFNDCKKVTESNNYDGSRTIIFYYTNGVKNVFKVAA